MWNEVIPEEESRWNDLFQKWVRESIHFMAHCRTNSFQGGGGKIGTFIRRANSEEMNVTIEKLLDGSASM